jgi:hypothetical protein
LTGSCELADASLSEEMPYSDLAPSIFRQRLVVEGYPAREISGGQIACYLEELSRVCGMTTLAKPVTHRSDRFGWAGWIHWETSGAHFYAWDRPVLFFSVDVYTCKQFDPTRVINFTREYFAAIAIASKSF